MAADKNAPLRQFSSPSWKCVFVTELQAPDAAGEIPLRYDGIASGGDVYAYVDGDPVSRADPLGLRWYTGAGVVLNASSVPITVTGDTRAGGEMSVTIPPGGSVDFDRRWIEAVVDAVSGQGMKAFDRKLVDPDFIKVPGCKPRKVTPFFTQTVVVREGGAVDGCKCEK